MIEVLLIIWGLISIFISFTITLIIAKKIDPDFTRPLDRTRWS